MNGTGRRDVQAPGFFVHHDCRHYTGYKPCGLNPECRGCEKYDPVGPRILIIKLGAMGDVLRTTPVLGAVRREWPRAHVTWLTQAESHDLLRGNPLIDRLLVWGHDATVFLEVIDFDLLLNFEKEPAALALGERLRARERRGFRLTTSGTVGIADERAGYALRLGLDDDLKFRHNTVITQQVNCEMVGLDWGGDLYLFEPTDVSRAKRDAFVREHADLRGRTLVGVHTGCGPGFPTKQWSLENVADLVERLSRRPDSAVALMGGPRERDLCRRVHERCPGLAIDTGCDNSLEEFVGLLMACDVVVSSDSLPMHLAIALGRPLVALFGPTSAREVDLGPLGEKVVTDFECSPCYLKTCDKDPLCMEAMGADLVLEAIERALAKSRVESRGSTIDHRPSTIDHR
jgi:ADP-heptose:LPS heptosyltransferase